MTAFDEVASQRPPLIQLNNVTKIYGHGHAAMHALRGISMQIERGEFVAVMGPSGCGKSTCMNILGCLDIPTSGEYFFEGANVGLLSSDQRALLRRHKLGFVFQGYNLLSNTSALENVELPLIYQGIATHLRRQRALEMLANVGLAGWELHTPSELSGGQQQRVAVARALASRPAIVLADEPTANLDSKTAEDLITLMSELNRTSGITFLMATHDARVIARTRRHIVITDGKIASDEHRTQPAS